MDNGTVGTFEFAAMPEDVEKFMGLVNEGKNLVHIGDNAGNEFQFVISGNPEMCGCGGNGCKHDDGENTMRDSALKDWRSIFDKAYIAKYKDGEKSLYAFTGDDLMQMELLIQFFADQYDVINKELFEVLDEYNKASIVPEAERILRSGDRLIVFWEDGDKTIVKRSPDEADSNYIAFTAALGKKIFGTNSKLARFIKKKLEYQKPKEKVVKHIPEDAEEVFAYDDAKWTSHTVTLNKKEGSIYAE